MQRSLELLSNGCPGKRKDTIIRLAFSLINSDPENHRVTLKGYRYLSLLMTDNTESFSPVLLNDLHEAENWLNDQHTERKRQILLELLSIRFCGKETCIKGLEDHLGYCLTEAKKRYSSLFGKSDYAYRDVNKQVLNNLSEEGSVYKKKSNACINRLLRDILLFLAITTIIIQSPFDISTIHRLLKYMATGATYYFIIYPVIRSIKDIIFILTSRNRIIYWKFYMSELISEEDYRSLIVQPLKNISLTLSLTYPLLLLTSIAFAILCSHLPEFLIFKK